MMRIACLQTRVYHEKKRNLDNAARLLEGLRGKEVDIVTLPETFNCPYLPSNFPIYAEEEGGETFSFCSRLAKEHKVYFSAGSIPEVDEQGCVYNTAYMFNREGECISKHRKLHMFDVDIKGGQRFLESETLTPGHSIEVFDTEFCKMGLMVCYDFRFPEMSRLMMLAGARVVIVPAAFNMTTGPAHWEILFRTRAMENQLFVVGTAPARDLDFSYHSWGHSLVVNPWGKVQDELDEKEGVLIVNINLAEVDKYRQEIPMVKNRRTDLYDLHMID